jgi:hypothetical protein
MTIKELKYFIMMYEDLYGPDRQVLIRTSSKLHEVGKCYNEKVCNTGDVINEVFNSPEDTPEDEILSRVEFVDAAIMEIEKEDEPRPKLTDIENIGYN